jgi:6-phosphofructokinase 1
MGWRYMESCVAIPGMVENDIFKMESRSVANIIQRGGTILKTSRCKDFFTPQGRKKAYDNLKKIGDQWAL